MKKNIFLIFLSFLVICFAACATGPKLPPGARQPSETAQAAVNTPERKASEDLVQQGEKALEQGLNDRAADLFQEAVNVDTTHGAAYYYLSFVKMRSGEYGEAIALDEKAELLLSGDPTWADKLAELRQELFQRKPLGK